MSEIILREIDAVLMERLRRLADARGGSLQDTLLHVLEQGLFACEASRARSLNDADAKALQEAIAALEAVPDDPGFAKIGRADGTEAPARIEPDQSISNDLFPGEPPAKTSGAPPEGDG